MWLASPPNNDKDEGQKPKSGEESSGAPSKGSSRHRMKSWSAVEDKHTQQKARRKPCFFYLTPPATSGQPYWMAK